jgi:hypothetical protein
MRIYLLAALVTLPGCVTTTDPTPIGEGRYMVTLNAHGGFQSDGELLNQTIAKARAFCLSQNGSTLDVVNTDHGGTQMWTPQHNQVVFRCTPTQ